MRRFWLAVLVWNVLCVGIVVLVARRSTAQPAPPGQPAACTGSITILVNGKPLPTNSQGCVINLQSSQGVIASAAPDPAIAGTDIYFTPDPNIVLEVPTDQAWQNHTLKPSGDGHTFTVDTNPVFTAYSPGQLFSVLPSTAFLAAATINLNGIGPLALVDTSGNPLSQTVCPRGCLIQAVLTPSVPNPQGGPVNAFMVH